MPDQQSDSERQQGRKQRRGPRAPKRITPEYLHNYALFYLERYASSSANLRARMMQRARRACAFHGDDPEDAERMIDAEIARLQDVGLLNDGTYAEARAHSLTSRGASGRAIRAKLLQKGVDDETIDAAMQSREEAHGEPEFDAALTFARKRRLGPFRTGEAEDRLARREKDLAAMSRAGFSYDMALRVVDAESAEALEEEHWRLRRQTGGTG